MVYYGYRYYDADNGRWLNQDPIGVNGGINVYNSVSNNMVNGFAGWFGFDDGMSIRTGEFVEKSKVDSWGLRDTTKHEQKIILMINQLIASAKKEKQFTARLHGKPSFVERLEKVKSIIVNKIKKVIKDQPDPVDLGFVLAGLKEWTKQNPKLTEKDSEYLFPKSNNFGYGGVGLVVTYHPLGRKKNKCNAYIAQALYKSYGIGVGYQGFRNYPYVATHWADGTAAKKGSNQNKIGNGKNYKFVYRTGKNPSFGDIIGLPSKNGQGHVGIYLADDIYISATNQPSAASVPGSFTIQPIDGVLIKDSGGMKVYKGKDWDYRINTIKLK